MANRFNPHQHPMPQPGDGSQAQSFFYHPASAQQQQQQIYQGYPQGFPPLHLMAPQHQMQLLQTLNEAQRRQALQQQQQQQEMKNRSAASLPPPQQQQQHPQHPGFARLSAAELLLLQQQQQQQQQERELRQRLGLPEGAILASYGGNAANAAAANNFLANITLAQMRQQQQQQQYQQQLSQLQSQQQQQQQQQQSTQQQLAALMAAGKVSAGAAASTAGMGGAGGMMMLSSAVGPHLDPAIAAASPAMQQQPGSTAILSNSSAAAAAAAAAPPATGPAAGGTGPAAAATGKGKIEVDDEYGLKQLVKVVQAPLPMSTTPYVPSADEPTDPVSGRPVSQQDADELNFTFITRGVDITQIGLSVTEEGWLHTTLATLPLDSYEYFILPEFKIPESYKKPRPKSLSMKSFHQFKEETLFYIFYSMPRDVLHLAAARALYERGWRYNKRAQHWLHPVKAEDGTLMEKVTTGPDGQKIFTGTYTIFQPNEWKQSRTQPNHTIAAADIEEQSALVAAMEEAARQQSQRARGKTAHGASGSAAAGSNGSNSNTANSSAPPGNA
ncbi:hypothetical protein LSCM1_07842 [Leishmania martiniquensis]|uniref:NOT2/NOT3/NOT5 C-terminal domain-containing protein n=1 Tax=Leishmania martiniquensis TaxID=1580590 RepID=A0A836HE34_9TRYP|nr:hypothetical protein LSCM1_07842 [Leishmania martiniquensis]